MKTCPRPLFNFGKQSKKKLSGKKDTLNEEYQIS